MTHGYGAVDCSPLARCVIGPDGRVVCANDALLMLLGLPPHPVHDPSGRPFTSCVHPDDGVRVRAALLRARHTSPQRVAVRWRDGRGRWLTLEWLLTRTRDRGCVLATARRTEDAPSVP